ncbi:alpha/beta fold hydrolase [Amycolatopsis taiwanensis]|uniref:Alpha/beta hydrolase n=1 Tax=Amycolatopsis taiwanensis TaxID=342230 RepID=A0A9W6QVW0_9PSEU|nr:alpha/beta hydrolase [Amycolatopsis taiwanensis]GLY64991.1 alpha/beta hydrolase [Amycolatopsis taiwanensis]
MGDYETVNEVRTWYEATGEGEPLVLLHGGFSDARDFAGNLGTLPFRIYTPERRGHGHTPDVEGPITLDLMADDMIAFIDKVVGEPVHLAGYSAGGIVALLVALRRPDLVRRLVLVSAAFHHSGMLFSPAAGGEIPEPIVARYAEVSPDGRDHLPVVAAKIAAAATGEPSLTEADLRAIGCPTLVMAADDDIVTLEHTLALYRALPAGELAVVPHTSHVLLHEKPALCARLAEQFLTAEPAALFMPIRRAEQA